MDDRLKKHLSLLSKGPEEVIEVLFNGMLRLVDKASGRVILCASEAEAMREAMLHKNCIEHAQKMRLADLLSEDYAVLVLPEPAPRYVSFLLSRKKKDIILPFNNFAELVAMFHHKAKLKNNPYGASDTKHLPGFLEIDGKPTPLAIWLYEN